MAQRITKRKKKQKYQSKTEKRTGGKKGKETSDMSMALSSSLRALARPILPFDSFSARLWLSGVAAPAVHARRQPRPRGAGVVVLAAAMPSDAEWLPEKKKPLYTHSLPCIEDRSIWVAEMPLWHARLSLDVADLHIRYMKSSPGNLEKDVDRRFSYAVSREDIENTILGRTLIPSQGSKFGVYKHVFPSDGGRHRQCRSRSTSIIKELQG